MTQCESHERVTQAGGGGRRGVGGVTVCPMPRQQQSALCIKRLSQRVSRQTAQRTDCFLRSPLSSFEPRQQPSAGKSRPTLFLYRKSLKQIFFLKFLSQKLILFNKLK